MMPLYRARITEVKALDLGDGRHVVLGATPRYVPSAEFLEAFELVEERRVIERRRPNGRGGKKKRGDRRKAARRLRPTVADGIKAVVNGTRLPRGGVNPQQEEARRLYEVDGKGLPDIEKQLNVKYPTLYGWKTRGEWKQAKPPQPTTTPAPARTPAASKSKEPGGAKEFATWMD